MGRRSASRRSSPSFSPARNTTATAARRRFARISECARAGRETLAERQGWPARAQDEPATGASVQLATGSAPGLKTTRPRVEPGAEPFSAGDATAAAGEPAAPAPRGSRRRIPSTVRPPAHQEMAPGSGGRSRSLSCSWRSPSSPTSFGSRRRRARLADTVATLDLNELDSAWLQYRELRGGSLGVGVFGLERALIRQTVTLTERVFANYRTPSPSVREAQWRGGARAARVRAGGAPRRPRTEGGAALRRRPPPPDRRRSAQGAEAGRRRAA